MNSAHPMDPTFDLTDVPEVAPLEKVIEAHVLKALRATEGNKTRAARLLGITRDRTIRLVKKYRIAL